MNRDRVHKHTYTTWGDQACQNPAHWSDLFARYMSNIGPTPGEGNTSRDNHGRGSLRPLFNEVVDALTMAFGADQPPDDPVDTVWRIFPRLDREHCARLADLLMAERAHE